MNVFVYGSLKRGFGNHSTMLAAGGKLVGTDAIPAGHFKMVSLGSFPGLLVDQDGPRIIGEVYDVVQMLPLDRLEGYPNFYDRTEITTEAGIKCFVYFLHDDDGEVIPSGEWTRGQR
jgi:gamma-glutamylcyclotransferase (GGCT)/AIG2-like uncharacterized protein YtfP